MFQEQKDKFSVIFMGTPDIAIPSLDLLRSHPKIELLKVVTPPDRPAGRGMQLATPEVALWAQEHGVPLLQTANINTETDFIHQYSGKVDLLIVFAFSQFLKSAVLKIPKIGPFNIHTSLLPKYRGASPIHFALLNGDRQTGISIQKIVKRMDAGDVYHSGVLNIGEDENYSLLKTRMQFYAPLLLNEFIDKLSLHELVPQEQNESEVSLAPTIAKEQGYLNFWEWNSQSIYQRILALNPAPGTYSFLEKKRLKILEAKKTATPVNPGKVVWEKGSFLIGCADGLGLDILKLQLEGKKVQEAIEFMRGFKSVPELNRP